MPRLVDAGKALWLRAALPLTRTAGQEATARALRAARLRVVPEWYVALSYLSAILSGLVVGAAAWAGAGFGARLPFPVAFPIALASGLAGFALVRLGFLAYPRLRASGRGRRIDAELPGGLVLAYALARGGVGVLDVMRTLASEREAYGELAVEAGIVVRDVDWMGMDLVSALQDTASSTPSARLRAFLEGLVTLLNSGADPRDYLRNQAKALLQQGELTLETELEQAGLLAEVYVSGLLVLPLLLIVVLAGLSPLGGGQESLIPLLVFALIPVGTGLYLAVVETLLPPEPLSVPDAGRIEADFGMTTQADAALLPPPWRMAAPGWPGMRVAMEATRLRLRDAWRRWTTRVMAKPIDAVEISGVLALAVFLGGALSLWLAGASGDALLVGATGVILVAAIVAVVPVSVLHELRVRQARRVDEALPDTLSKLAGFNERGIDLLQAFRILGRNATGALSGELRAAERDVAWNGSLANALRRLRARVNTQRVAKVGILLERASHATGRLKDVLDVAAEDATVTTNLRTRRHRTMLSYVVVVYIVFAVFLYVLYTVATLFYAQEGFGGLRASGGGLSSGMDPAAARIMLMQAAIVQGVCCGLVAGRLGEGHLLSGLKHAAILGLASLALFLGVVR